MEKTKKPKQTTKATIKRNGRLQGSQRGQQVSFRLVFPLFPEWVLDDDVSSSGPAASSSWFFRVPVKRLMRVNMTNPMLAPIPIDPTRGTANIVTILKRDSDHHSTNLKTPKYQKSWHHWKRH